MTHPAIPDIFYFNRNKALSFESVWQIDNYFVNGNLNTEYELDYWAGTDAGGVYRKKYKQIEEEFGLQRVYIISRVYAHAAKYYEDGWDTLSECVDPVEVNEIIEKDLDTESDYTISDVIRCVANGLYLEAHLDQRNDALAAGGLEITNFKLGV